jgi:hypothetical protein
MPGRLLLTLDRELPAVHTFFQNAQAINAV